MLYHSSRFIRAIVASFIVSTRSSLSRRLVHLEPAKLALPVGCIPIGGYFLDQAFLAVAPNDPLLAPYFKGNIVEVGVISAELHHALHVVRPVGIKERGDYFDRSGDACHAHVHLSASFLSDS